MKNKFLFTLLLTFLFSLVAFAQTNTDKMQEFTAEEMAIKKVIEDETNYFYSNDYEKWAQCIAHDPMTSYTWVSPFKGEHGHWEAKGWEKISKDTKAFMKERAPDAEAPTKSNYQFKISENMAYVTFQESKGLEGLRVMEKKNGQWKILRMTAVASKAFDKFHKLNTLQRMAGDWEVDLSTYKKEGGGSWKLLGGTLSMVRTPTGIQSSENYQFHTKEGKLRSLEESIVYSIDMQNGKIGAYSISHYPYSGWSESYIAEGDIDEKGALNAKGKQIGDESGNRAEWSMWMEEDLLNWKIIVTDKDNKQLYASSCSMHRKGYPTASVGKP